ncbi:hypothetical protein PIB30_025638 [Stylosanthes scabra]|uniref:Uncharacterized protein n=1 Tax=Stylosanthes scabra TaxID=79078 RepID=A0ABU6UA12_9FABA|nr:hypothetical protein [Stylosanthes scabra]
MSSCVGLLPAPDDFLGSSPSMVHHCRMSWASTTQSGHVPSTRTCSQVPSARTGGTPKSLQLGLVANVPLVLSIGMVRISSPASSHKQEKPHRQGNRMINLASQGQPVQNHEPFPKRRTRFDRRVPYHRRPNRIDLNRHN